MITSNPVLVTGAAGFIGRRLVLDLRRSGVEVRALLRGQHDRVDLEASGAEIVRGDAADPDVMREAAAGCDAVFHLAAARGYKKLKQSEFCRINADIQAAAAKAAQANAARLVAVSSVTTMKGHPPHAAADLPHRPVADYSLSRAHCELQLHSIGKKSGLDYRVARIAERVAGPGAKDWSKVILAIQQGLYRILPSGGSIHSCDVDDVVAGLRLCASDAASSGETYVLTAREPGRILDAFRSIADELEVPFEPTIVPGWPARAYKRMGDVVFSRFRWELPYAYTAGFFAWPSHYDNAQTPERLGFAPRYSVCDALRRTVDWMRSEGHL